jgi:small subunit ribosomal protein S11e
MDSEVEGVCPFVAFVFRFSGPSSRIASTSIHSTQNPLSNPTNQPTTQNSFEKRHKNLAAHWSPAFPQIKEGDIVTVGQCRPLSKTVRFNVLQHEPAINAALNVKKQFRVF